MVVEGAGGRRTLTGCCVWAEITMLIFSIRVLTGSILCLHHFGQRRTIRSGWLVR